MYIIVSTKWLPQTFPRVLSVELMEDDFHRNKETEANEKENELLGKEQDLKSVKSLGL